MQFKSLKIGYVVLIFSLMLTGLAGTVHAVSITTPSSCPATLPSGTANANYSYTFVGDGNAANAWTITSSNLPSTLTLTSQTKTQAILSGTPTTTGTYTFTMNYKNDGNCVCTLTVNPAVSLSPTSGFTTQAHVNNQYTSEKMTASGGTGTLTWTSTALPGGGLCLNTTSIATCPGTGCNGNTTCYVTGTPTSSAPTSIPVKVADANGAYAQVTYTLTIITNKCTTSGNGTIDFGTLNANANAGGLTESASYVTTKPNICCTANSTYAVTAAGAHGGTNVGSGYRLKHGTSDYITYSISYVTPITGQGDTVNIGATDLNLKAGFLAGALDNAPAGQYTDTITLTITY